MFTLLSSIFLLLLLLPTLPTLPTPSPTGTPGGVYLCPSSHFHPSPTHPCLWRAPTKSCLDLRGPDTPFPAFPISIGPDAGGYYLFYDVPGCNGDAMQLPRTLEDVKAGVKTIALVWPGIEVVSDLGTVAKSMQCREGVSPF